MIKMNQIIRTYHIKAHINLKIKVFTRATGKMDKDMEEVNKFGLMARYMKGIGRKM